MADDQGYNGWKNYETWCVSLWLGNEQSTDTDVRELAESLAGQAERDGRGGWSVNGRSLTGALADALKDYVEELPEYAEVQETASFVSDLAACGVVGGRLVRDGRQPAVRCRHARAG